MTGLPIPDQRSIFDRREIGERVDTLVAEHGDAARSHVVALLKDALEQGRAEMARRLEAQPSAGHAIAGGYAFLIDQLIRTVHEFVTQHTYPAANRSTGERLAIMAVGGYGRSEMAPHSDVDIAFLVAERRNSWCEQVVEAMLYILWDLGLKVGHSTRTLDEAIRLARSDLTIRTALLEGRFVWGDRALYDEGGRRYTIDVVRGNERAFLTQKLAERNARHKRMGDSRYVVEPNVKDGKGGLRDLQTLYWIGKFMHRVTSASQLVDKGLMTQAEYHGFRRAERFLLAVRCHMHILAGRAEDRLTFDLQRQIAQRMAFADRPGRSAVERFMQFYFLQVKRVGSLTGVFLAHIEEQFDRTAHRTGFFAGFRPRARTIKGYRVFGGRIAAPADDWFARDPVRLIEIFQIAEAEELEIHPDTMRQAGRDARLITHDMREDPRANALFLDVLCGRNNAEAVLRWMNETGVFGRFVPDFGRVNAQMQFDMYHHYTVDEHTIRAIGLLAQIERGALNDEHPRAARLIHTVASRRVAYVAALLHDIAKGRGGDHSLLGGDVAEELCPRFSLSAKETDLVAWLVRHHLLMSHTAQKRDLTDPKTIEDFVAIVQSMERLRHLAILTAVDIRAVGPGTWNSWKGQLLGELYDAASERMRLGHMRQGRAHRVAAKRAAVAQLLGDKADLVEKCGAQFGDAYWVAEPVDIIALNLVHFDAARTMSHDLSIHCEVYDARGATLVTVIAADHPGLFYRIAGGIHLAGGNVIDARIHTSRSGYAMDNFLVQDPHGAPFRDKAQLDRLVRQIEDALVQGLDLSPRLAQRPLAKSGSRAFDVSPQVAFDNKASNRFTVIEVNARDRSALLYRLARELFDSRLVVHSAHITNYGERAVDTFYVTDLTGGKLMAGERQSTIEARLIDAASDAMQARLEDA